MAGRLRVGPGEFADALAEVGEEGPPVVVGDRLQQGVLDHSVDVALRQRVEQPAAVADVAVRRHGFHAEFPPEPAHRQHVRPVLLHEGVGSVQHRVQRQGGSGDHDAR